MLVLRGGEGAPRKRNGSGLKLILVWLLIECQFMSYLQVVCNVASV